MTTVHVIVTLGSGMSTDCVVSKGNQLVLDIDVLDNTGEQVDLAEATVRYVLGEEVDETRVPPEDEEEEAGVVQVQEVEDLANRVHIAFPVDFEPGSYRHECKYRTEEDGPFAIIASGTVYVMESLIGDEL